MVINHDYQVCVSSVSQFVFVFMELWFPPPLFLYAIKLVMKWYVSFIYLFV